jgi:hypothetical protein
MASVIPDTGSDSARETVADRGEVAQSKTEVIESVAVAGASGKLLTRSQVAHALGLSLSTVRRMEGSELRPIVGPRGVRYFEETEIQAVFVRVRRTRVPGDERAEGALAAAAFELFRSGADVVAVVKALREPPEKIEALFQHWRRLRGMVLLDAESLATLAADLSASDLASEDALLSAAATFRNDAQQSCVLCEREPAHLCRRCAQEAGRTHVLERDARKLF